MTPALCRVEHDPENGKYGDCVRACIASVLDIADPLDVPHFYCDDDVTRGATRITEWLRLRECAPFWSHYPGDGLTLDALLSYMGDVNPNCTYILFGATANGGNHAVVCQGGAIVHDPNWIPSPIVAPCANDYWTVLVVALT